MDGTIKWTDRIDLNYKFSFKGFSTKNIISPPVQISLSILHVHFLLREGNDEKWSPTPPKTFWRKLKTHSTKISIIEGGRRKKEEKGTKALGQQR